jgi:N-methylhydantoinase B/oxoprolinase/acetone carboxylase alpha subunit
MGKEGVDEADKLFAQNTKNGKEILEALKNDTQAYKDVIADVLAKIAAKHAAETNIANKKAAYNTEYGKLYMDKLNLATEARIEELLAEKD